MPRKPAPTAAEQAEEEPAVTEQVDDGTSLAEQVENEPADPEVDDGTPADEQPDDEPTVPEQVDDETRYQRELAAQRRAAYQREHDGNMRAGHTDRAEAVRAAYEAEFGESIPESPPVETAEDKAPRRTARASKRD